MQTDPGYTPFAGPILLGAGGTGGHMFPAQALAEELKRRQHRVLLITDARGMRYAKEFPADDIIEIKAANPSARGIGAKLSAGFALTGGMMRALKEIKRQKPLAAVGFGGYPSLPAMQAAAFSRTPYGLHEQNSLLGRANRFLAPNAQFLAHGFATLVGAPSNAKHVQEVGNPVRDQVLAVAASPYQAPGDHGPFRILITGGSQGASLFSAIPAEAICALPNHLRDRLEVIHQVRENDIDQVETVYRQNNVRAQVAPFFRDLPERMVGAHLLIARAGASTVTEIATIGRPSILVPLAIAMDDHQTVNARVLSEAKAAILMPEADFAAGPLRRALEDAMTKPSQLVQMASNAKGRVKPDAARTIADLVEAMIERHRAK